MGTKVTSMKTVVLTTVSFVIPGHPGPSSWGWINLQHICEEVPPVQGLRNEKLGLDYRKLHPYELLERYARLSKDPGILAVVVNFDFDNWDIEELIQLLRSKVELGDLDPEVYVPAGWANAVIGEATGATEARRQKDAEDEALRIATELGQIGYASIRWDNSELSGGPDDIARRAIELVRGVATVHNQPIADITAEVNRVQSSDPPPYSEFETVFYNTDRFEMASVHYGQRHFEEAAALGDGWFSVTSDGVHCRENGAVYYLRPLR